jgi:hypothetical protein
MELYIFISCAFIGGAVVGMFFGGYSANSYWASKAGKSESSVHWRGEFYRVMTEKDYTAKTIIAMVMSHDH